MITSDFNFLLDEQIKTCQNMLVSKATEYATTADRLHNFKIAANLKGCTLREAVGGLMVKHTVSVYDMIRDDNAFPMEVWNEKITDHLNYLFLLKAVLYEEALEREQADIAQKASTNAKAEG